MKTVTINLYGGPGIGKSTTAAGLFYEMKKAGYSVELVTEYIKGAVWEDRVSVINDQLYILAKQARKLSILEGKVEFIITDSPILLTLIYCEDKSIHNVAKKIHFNSKPIDVFLQREKQYVEAGRLHTEVEARKIDSKIIKRLGPLVKSPQYLQGVEEIMEHIRSLNE